VHAQNSCFEMMVENLNPSRLCMRKIHAFEVMVENLNPSSLRIRKIPAFKMMVVNSTNLRCSEAFGGQSNFHQRKGNEQAYSSRFQDDPAKLCTFCLLNESETQRNPSAKRFSPA
jgi:hypothetical protein